MNRTDMQESEIKDLSVIEVERLNDNLLKSRLMVPAKVEIFCINVFSRVL